MELYRKIYIKSEADLPKHEMFLDKYIIFHDKDTDHVSYEKGYSSTWNDSFMRDVDWYLQPIEITDADIEAWAEEVAIITTGKSKHGHIIKAALFTGAKAVINGEIKHK